ncbi:hypothetical protein TNCV_2334001 [Trichonephila clavipes]|nr:hypothetical protein TNCV_2334001 [Trichonephila clavipes]
MKANLEMFMIGEEKDKFPGNRGKINNRVSNKLFDPLPHMTIIPAKSTRVVENVSKFFNEYKSKEEIAWQFKIQMEERVKRDEVAKRDENARRKIYGISEEIEIKA